MDTTIKHDNSITDYHSHLLTLFISIRTSLIQYLEYIKRLTETHLFDTVINSGKDFRIKSPIHIIHDPNIEKNHVSITVKCYHPKRGKYINNTLIHKLFLPNKLEHLEKEFSNTSVFYVENRLIQIHGDFSPWNISPYRRIAIDRYWPDMDSSLEELIPDFNLKTDDKIILDLGHEYDIEYNLETDLSYIKSVLTENTNFDGLILLIPKSEQEHWKNKNSNSLSTNHVLIYSDFKSTDTVYYVFLLINNFFRN